MPSTILKWEEPERTYYIQEKNDGLFWCYDSLYVSPAPLKFISPIIHMLLSKPNYWFYLIQSKFVPASGSGVTVVRFRFT